MGESIGLGLLREAALPPLPIPFLKAIGKSVDFKNSYVTEICYLRPNQKFYLKSFMGFRTVLVTLVLIYTLVIFVRQASTLQGSLQRQSGATWVVTRYRLASKIYLKFLPAAVLSDPQQ